ncbi:MAG TPA: preprotein translocase subunit YajC [Saprospiraceae bacterium]|nr:preprotein translocase subunit YajC [Saprospiraceae bacterium]HRO08757.1 preprotein translocase subunit YajC [Saprospiraceae bacterium]HRO74027.1 preprotein translocase subunit YajC [Saprospiraceae bacterium]HRP41622.1 preprotein translocase subunit YajC [Saprospiraceae bacterium]
MYLSFILQSSAGLSGLLFPVLMLAAFYFFFIRPQMKKQKEQNAFSADLKKGDIVVTASGIIGQINKIEGNIITLEIDSKTYVSMFASAVSKEMTEQYNKSK